MSSHVRLDEISSCGSDPYAMVVEIAIAYNPQSVEPDCFGVSMVFTFISYFLLGDISWAIICSVVANAHAQHYYY